MRRLNTQEVIEFSNYLKMEIGNAVEICEIIFLEKEKGNYRITIPNLNTLDDYIREWENNWYRYYSWEKLIESEKDQGIYGLTEEQCKQLINQAIFELSSGVFIQNVF